MIKCGVESINGFVSIKLARELLCGVCESYSELGVCKINKYIYIYIYCKWREIK